MLAKSAPRGRSRIGAGVWRLQLLAMVACATQQGTSIAPSEIVLESQGRYSLLLMTSGWTRITGSTKDELESDLILSNAKAGVTVFVNVHPQAEQSIDSVVFGRRKILAQNNEILSSEEERSFLERSDFVPVSVVRYRMRGKQASAWFPLIVGTARGPDSIVEVLAIGGHPTQLDGLFEDVLSGLRIPAASGAAP